MVPQIFGQESADLLAGHRRHPRPGQAKSALHFGDQRGPSVQQALVRSMESRAAAAAGFRLKHMAQPEQMAECRLNTVTPWKRLCNFEGVAHLGDDGRRNARGIEHVEPKWRKAANSRILKNEQARLSELAVEYRQRLLLEFRRLGRRMPAGIEFQPVVPVGTCRLQNLVVEFHDRNRFPMTGFIGVGRIHQCVRQVAAEQV